MSYQRIQSFCLALSFLFLVPVAFAEKPTSNPTSTPKKAIKPVVRKATVAKVAKKTSVKVRKLIYDIYRGKKKVGTYTRTETPQANGDLSVVNESNFSFRYFLFRISLKSKSNCFYQKGNLVRFTVDSEFRGKKSKVWGTQDQKGITINREAKGKKIKKFIARKEYQGTSLDLPIRPDSLKKGMKRSLLMVPRMLISKQKLKILSSSSKKYLGKELKTWNIQVKSGRGVATIIVDQKGQMLETQFKSPGGTLIFRIRSSS